QDGQVVHDHAHISDHRVVVGRTGVVVGVVLLAIVVAAFSTPPAASACVGAGRRDCRGPKNPTNHKNHTNNFGPHRSMFLSIDVNRGQHLTTINTKDSSANGRNRPIEETRTTVGHIASGVFTERQQWAPEKCHHAFTQWPLWPQDAWPDGDERVPAWSAR